MLQHFGVGDAYPKFGSRLLDRIALQEARFQNPAIVVRQTFENVSDTLGRGADRFLALGWLFDVVDRGYLSAQGFPPVRGQHRSGGGPQVSAHLADARGQAQRPQRGQEDFGGEVLGVRPVADPGEQGAVHPGSVVLVHRFPVGVAIVWHSAQGSRVGGFVVCGHVPPSPIYICSGYTRRQPAATEASAAISSSNLAAVAESAFLVMPTIRSCTRGFADTGVSRRLKTSRRAEDSQA